MESQCNNASGLLAMTRKGRAVTNLADRWGIHPEHFWLRGQWPERTVAFDEKTGMWNVYGYPEALAVIGDPATFSNDTARLFPVPVDGPISDGDLLQMDPPEHRRQRLLVNHAFTPKIVSDLEPRISKLTHELLDKVAGRDRFDLMETLVYPLPAVVVADLLGVPAADTHLFETWMRKMSESATADISLGDVSEDQERAFKVTMEQTEQMLDYLRVVTAECRKSPREDLLSQLVQAEVEGARLSDDQVVNFAKMLLIAGYLTTTMLLGNTVLCLDGFPEVDARVRADRSLMPTLVEESMRYLSPIAATYRATTSEVEIAGVTIPKDQLVLVWLAAANRDERQFARPQVFDPARDPNPQLGFSRGTHFCLGAPLARMEGQVVLNILLDRFPVLKVDPDIPPTFYPAPDTTGVSTLSVRTG
ncbi:cytochrome P450 [Amycolatopsis sp. MEPSY49]|uniref:cytochrome P450 n=1 Tax=Amycolatopsis sp. MEPSY49 TaxID=3151600 RepID=UPI003EF3A4A7